MTQEYPGKAFTIGVLNEAASYMAEESSAEHPGDIAIAMINAIEAAVVTVEVLWKRGLLS